jgi:hypothetical protein
VTLNSLTGALSGTPTAFGSFTVGLTVTDATDATNKATASYALSIAPAAIAISTATVPAGQVGAPYAASFAVSGGTGSYVWTVSGLLPSGVTINPSTGALSGTPTAFGSFAFSVSAADAADAANSATASFSVTIAPAPVAIITSTLPGGQATVAYSAVLTANGGTGAYVWSVSAGALPAGLTLNATSGAITGTPTTAGSFTFTVTAADATTTTNRASASFTVSIATAPKLKITSSRTLPYAQLGVAYAYQITAANVTGTAKWGLAGGALPPGIKLDAATGVLSGTPTKKGTFSFNARVVDAVSSDTMTLTIAVK